MKNIQKPLRRLLRRLTKMRRGRRSKGTIILNFIEAFKKK